VACALLSLGQTLRRFLYVAAVALWLGGFTFYAAFVIPAGTKVLGGHLRQGFITQRVTGRLNLIAPIALGILLWNAVAMWPAQRRFGRWCLAASWAVMAIIQVGLLVMHPMLDRLLEPRDRSIADGPQFDLLHRTYLISSTVQWSAGILFVWCMEAMRHGTNVSRRATDQSGKVSD
jgi:hypothetical protein